ncbi:MAG: hypothetical protein ACYDAW_03745 [Acidithiobacillus ferrivorans]
MFPPGSSALVGQVLIQCGAIACDQVGHGHGSEVAAIGAALNDVVVGGFPVPA